MAANISIQDTDKKQNKEELFHLNNSGTKWSFNMILIQRIKMSQQASVGSQINALSNYCYTAVTEIVTVRKFYSIL